MGRKTLSIRKNADETITVKTARYTESIEVNGKTSYELYEAVKWAIIGSGFPFSEEASDMAKTELGLL